MRLAYNSLVPSLSLLHCWKNVEEHVQILWVFYKPLTEGLPVHPVLFRPFLYFEAKPQHILSNSLKLGTFMVVKLVHVSLVASTTRSTVVCPARPLVGSSETHSAHCWVFIGPPQKCRTQITQPTYRSTSCVVHPLFCVTARVQIPKCGTKFNSLVLCNPIFTKSKIHQSQSQKIQTVPTLLVLSLHLCTLFRSSSTSWISGSGPRRARTPASCRGPGRSTPAPRGRSGRRRRCWRRTTTGTCRPAPRSAPCEAPSVFRASSHRTRLQLTPDASQTHTGRIANSHRTRRRFTPDTTRKENFYAASMDTLRFVSNVVQSKTTLSVCFVFFFSPCNLFKILVTRKNPNLLHYSAVFIEDKCPLRLRQVLPALWLWRGLYFGTPDRFPSSHPLHRHWHCSCLAFACGFLKFMTCPENLPGMEEVHPSFITKTLIPTLCRKKKYLPLCGLQNLKHLE